MLGKLKRAIFPALGGGAGMALVGTLTGMITNALTGEQAALKEHGGGWATYIFALLGSNAYAGFIWGLFYPRFAAKAKGWLLHGLLFGLGLFLAGLLPGVILIDITLGMKGVLISTWGISSLLAALGGGMATAYIYNAMTKEKDAGQDHMDILLGREKTETKAE